MNDYILYSLPLDCTRDLEAIENKKYFKVLVRHIDSNTFEILHVYNNIACCDFCTAGTHLELHQFKYLKRYFSQTAEWNSVPPQFRAIHILQKGLDQINCGADGSLASLNAANLACKSSNRALYSFVGNIL
jgi:hypothetical protein